MNACDINITPKGQILKEMSGLGEYETGTFVNYFLEENGRYPRLDEIPKANSENYFNKQFDIKSTDSTKYTSAEILLQHTNTSTIRESNAVINKEYADLEVHLDQIGDAVIVEVEHRPSDYNEESYPIKTLDIDTQYSPLIINNALTRLQKYYGVQMIPITTSEIANDVTLNQLATPEASAFIYNGNIYINTDKASIESPIHEQLHLFLGSIRYSDPSTYFQIVQSIAGLSNFQEIASRYPNRSISDIQEEIFVEEFSKYLANKPSKIETLNKNIINNILYYIKRDIDTIIKGKDTVKMIRDPFNKSLKELGELLSSENFNIDNMGTLDQATIHRMMANTKQELMEKNELIQNCQ